MFVLTFVVAVAAAALIRRSFTPLCIAPLVIAAAFLWTATARSRGRPPDPSRQAGEGPVPQTWFRGPPR